MTGCAAPNCHNSSRKNVRLFRFPRDEHRRKLWISNCKLNCSETIIYTRICEIHFEENQFELHRQDGWKKLKPNAVPTVFPDPPESPKKTKEKAQKHKRSSSAELDSEIKVPKKKRKKNLASEEDSQTVKRKKSSRKKNASHSSSDGSSKENVSPTRRKGRPRKISNPEPLIDLNADQRSLCPCGNNNSSVKPRVVGGHDAGKGQFPYASCLIDGTWRTEKPIPFCGATLITDSHVVTAAHCIRERRACQTFAVSRASCRRESRLPKQVQYTHRAQHDLRRWTKRP
ncbi:unnamed protein product [Larinioides sclopetarius]|uniref:THAP-type domain-containing protein n=1 Tax=Larinioides sclopetarius TaxID=280406 RepID=A0AAV2B4Z6_9ARAC